MVSRRSIEGTSRALDRQRIAALEERASLSDVIRTIPKECFEIDPLRAWTKVAVSTAAAALGWCFIWWSPWYLLPLAWVFTGTALTGWFVIAHDCAHRSFFKSRRLNDIVGHLMLLPLLYPFHGWRIHHNQHHTYTNNVDLDNAWRPMPVAEYRALSPLKKAGYRLARGWGYCLGSIVHQFALHFRPSLVKPKERGDIRLSAYAIYGFAALWFPGLWLLGGPWAIVSLWLMPFLVYHFWMSTFTLVHHTHPDIPFYTPENWTPVTGQLFSTIHCSYPGWVEFLCHDINVHIPHHVSTAIPSYRLRQAHAALKQNWSDWMHETEFSFSLLSVLVTECQLSDETGYYLPCRKAE